MNLKYYIYIIIMSHYYGTLTKMNTHFVAPIQYYLNLDVEIHVNDLINKQITLRYQGMQCLNCKRNGIKLYRMGHCTRCFFKSPQCADWILRPELSRAHLGIPERDLNYEKSIQLQPHIVYLALTGNVKVGVTKKSNFLTRWIDQGACEAIKILETPNRYLAGVAEVALKKHYKDITNWRKMLTNSYPNENLKSIRNTIKDLLPPELQAYLLPFEEVITLDFPVNMYPVNVKSVNLVKLNEFTGKLIGIKGQYLIFEDNYVFNIRSNEGLVISLNIN
jgi:hypothetical protein